MDSLKLEQIEALQSLLAGIDVLVILTTGFGNSLMCFNWQSYNISGELINYQYKINNNYDIHDKILPTACKLF